MSGGSWVTQNKIRPGAYINFKGVKKPSSSLGIRGIVALPMPLSWGAQVTEVLSTELADGSSLSKLGFTAVDEESQYLREALKNAYKAIVYRLDSGGTKATVESESLTVIAKYAGSAGNEITITIEAADDVFNVSTLFGSVVQHTQFAKTIDELVDNNFVEFSGTGNLTATAALPLEGGTNGTVSEANYLSFLNAVKGLNFDVLAMTSDEATTKESVITIIKDLRDNQGKKVQAVLHDVDANHEGIISVNQGYRTATEEVSPLAFVCYVAGLTAGSAVNESNTYHVIEGATEIIYPESVDPYDNEEIIELLEEGKFVLSHRSDGAVVVEQDINTLHTYSQDTNYAFSKNRVIRVLDAINNDIKLMFERAYIGKVNNNVDGRNIFKADVINYLNNLQNIAAITNFDSSADVVVYAGETIDSIVTDLAVQPVDSMEKLYMSVIVS